MVVYCCRFFHFLFVNKFRIGQNLSPSPKPADNFFSVSLSYVEPGTRFDLTCCQFGQTKMKERTICFSVTK